MQSGNRNSNRWLLEFLTNDTGINPLMGWESSTDTLSELKLEFATKELAIEYANTVSYTHLTLPTSDLV